MQATTNATRSRTRRNTATGRRRHPEFARITRFAKDHLNGNDARVLLVADHADASRFERYLCDTIVEFDAPLGVVDASLDPRFRSVRDNGDPVAGFLGVPLHGPDGRAMGALCVTTQEPRIWSRADRRMLSFLGAEIDATKRQSEATAAETRRADEQSLVAREYHHRIRNAFSVSAAVVILSGANEGSVQSLIETTSAQLSALADAHSTLDFAEEAADLSELIDATLTPYAFTGATVRVDGPAMQVSEDKIVPLSLILNELATNATKHGALGAAGIIDVSWTVAENSATLCWREYTPAPQTSCPQRTGSYGGTMVDVSVSQLGASLERQWLADGLDVTLTFPV